MTDKSTVVKRDKSRANLMRAFEDYKQGKSGSMDTLLQIVRKFAFTKVSHLEYERDFEEFGSAETADDWAQDVTIKVWQMLETFHGTAAQFYSWTHKIAFNQATDAFNNLLKEKKTKVSLFVKNEEDEGDDHDGDGESVENPIIHDQSGYGFSLQIPASVQGLDLTICKLLLTEVRGKDDQHRGRTYAEVGHVLDMTENAVETRLRKLRKRLKAEKEAARPTGK